MTEMVLLTGISGFLGSHIALKLLNRGYRVRGSIRNLDRSDEVLKTLESHGGAIKNLELVALDLTKDDGWSEAMDGIKYLQHVASPFVTKMPKDKMELIRPAVDGTTRAITAALAARVERIIVTSSMAAIMYKKDHDRSIPYSEKDWSDLDAPSANYYTQSKTLAEKKAWELMEEAGRRNDLVTINPSLILGPLLNKDPGTSGALVLRLLKGSIPAAPRFIFSMVDVRDVAEIHIKAMENKEAGGQRFATASDNLSIMDMANVIKAAYPQYRGKLPKFEMPDWVVRIYALFDSDVRSNIGEIGLERLIEASRAKNLLGHEFISSSEALIATTKTIIEQKLA
ncbi:Dihydroflavonol-4-reductase [hydrothermal vent metagenome]|uniref:Dihydroflavonol-4-reductase n=1 Tax=hydrothermal vent metagenome TaxID=652676 RepID=A0A3B0TZX0_9ZZZZ